jgi:arylsulfatase A-like enzyme
MRLFICICLGLLINSCSKKENLEKPNIILIMTDDQGWGQTGYYNHPVLKTPNLDEMARNGIRFDRFYAGAPVCSPTRASVLTGRVNDRTGVFDHGYALRTQEKTIAQALKKVGYSTGHFGKWHLNGLRGPGAPILKDDPYSPEKFGFDYWLSTTNFFDINPLMSKNGEFIDLKGTSSKVIFDEALRFIEKNKETKSPFFAVIWDGSPHDPWLANDNDKKSFQNLDQKSQNHYGELVAFDNNLGIFRKKLREMNVSDNTIIWYCSDNGGLKNINPETVGGLKGFKGSIWEGGIRVPAIIEWPLMIKKTQTTDYPASTMDIFPTIADIAQIDKLDMIQPIDGISLLPIINSKFEKREIKIPFRFKDKGALIDNNLKLIATSLINEEFELYDLKSDPKESNNLASTRPELFKNMKSEYLEWSLSVDSSVLGRDYPENTLLDQPERHFWMTDDRYKPYLDEFIKRPEYEKRIKRMK